MRRVGSAREKKPMNLRAATIWGKELLKQEDFFKAYDLYSRVCLPLS
jgi:hypothetical protein